MSVCSRPEILKDSSLSVVSAFHESTELVAWLLRTRRKGTKHSLGDCLDSPFLFKRCDEIYNDIEKLGEVLIAFSKH